MSIIAAQCDCLREKNLLGNQAGDQLAKLKSRFAHLLDSVGPIETRITYLENLIRLATTTDGLAAKIRNLSALSARRFMAEEDDNSIQTAIQEHLSIIDQMKAFDADMNAVKQEATDLSQGDILQLPVVFYDKITNTQDVIRQSLNEELEHRSSLLEIKQHGEHKQNKMETLCQNLDIIRNILDTRIPLDSLDHNEMKNSKSYKAETNSADLISNAPEYARFLLHLSKSKDIIQASKRLINELKQPMCGVSRANSPAPTCLDYQELRELECQMDAYSREVDAQIDLFENNLARKAELEAKFDRLSKNLYELTEKFQMYELKSLNDSRIEGGPEDPVEMLELEYDKLRIDLEQINKVKCELNAFTYDRVDLIKSNLINLNQSKIGGLCQGFNQVISEVDLKKDAELSVKLEVISGDIVRIEETCLLKLNEFKYQIEQHNIDKKQTKLNKLRDTLDLELDNLVNLKYFNDEEDLLIETEDILLDKVSMDGEADENRMDVFFNKTTELNIETQGDSAPKSNDFVDVRITRECLETNYNTSCDGESLANKSASQDELVEYGEQQEASEKSEESSDQDYEQENTFNITVIHETHRLVQCDENDAKKKAVTFADEQDMLETSRFERVTKQTRFDEMSEESNEPDFTSGEMARQREEEELEAERRRNLIETERLEFERMEREALEVERAEKQRQERLEQERIENQRLENERLEMQQLEAEMLEKENLRFVADDRVSFCDLKTTIEFFLRIVIKNFE